MRNVIYKVLFEVNPLLDGEFDFKEEAIAWAKEHLADKPIVKAVDIEYSDEFGGEPIVHEEEEIFHYPVEENAIAMDDEELAYRLKQLEAEQFVDPYEADEFDGHEELKEDTLSEIESVAANWDEVHEELKEEAEPIEEDVILFDPFGCDFSDCEPMEVCSDNHRADCCKDFSVNAVDFLKEFAAELGLEDEVEISEKECADGSCEEKHEDEIPCEDCKDEISEISDEVKDPEDVVPEEVKANEEPNVEVQVEDEKPTEETPVINISVETANLDANKVEEVASAITDAVEDVEKPEGTTVAFGVGVLDDQVEEPVEEAICPECGKEICECGNKELVEKNKVTHTTGDPAIGDAHFNGAFEGGEGVSENLNEDHHPEEAQPEVDHVKAFNAALEVAKKENKPVIYGYMGADHHGGNRYFEIEHIVCDDLNSCRQQVMNRYHPNGSVLVAYPDKEFVDESLTEAPAFINKLKEKHADKKDAKFKELVSKLGIDTTDPYIVVCSDLQGKEVDGTKKQFNRFAEAEDYARSWSKAHLGIAKVLFRDMSKVKSLVNLEYITKFTRGVNDYNNDANLEKLFKAVKWNDKTDQAAAKGQDFVDTAASVDGAEDSAETSKKGSKGSIANSRNIKIKKSLAAAGIDVSGLDKEKINALRKELFGEALEEDEDVPNSELENKELFVEEAEEEMSDLEFAEAFKKGLEEKHNCK